MRRRINSVQVRGSNGALRSQRFTYPPPAREHIRSSFNKGGTNPWPAKASRLAVASREERLATAARGDSPRLAPRHQQNPVP